MDSVTPTPHPSTNLFPTLQCSNQGLIGGCENGAKRPQPRAQSRSDGLRRARGGPSEGATKSPARATNGRPRPPPRAQASDIDPIAARDAAGGCLAARDDPPRPRQASQSRVWARADFSHASSARARAPHDPQRSTSIRHVLTSLSP
jgi:hypothetical protein